MSDTVKLTVIDRAITALKLYVDAEGNLPETLTISRIAIEQRLPYGALCGAMRRIAKTVKGQKTYKGIPSKASMVLAGRDDMQNEGNRIVNETNNNPAYVFNGYKDTAHKRVVEYILVKPTKENAKAIMEKELAKKTAIAEELAKRLKAAQDVLASLGHTIDA